jgi:hypothetical protein
MGNSVSANGKNFDVSASKNFLVLDKDTKPGLFKRLVRKGQYKNLDKAVGGVAATCIIPTITTDAQIFEMGTGTNWMVLLPILLLVALLFFAIVYYFMKHRKEA